MTIKEIAQEYQLSSLEDRRYATHLYFPSETLLVSTRGVIGKASAYTAQNFSKK